MSFRVDSGLFKFDFTDHHAILGVPVDADAKDIRKRYLKIARRLHPDSSSFLDTEKEWANQLLAKLVNPAYEKLSQPGSTVEYVLLLSQMGKRLVEESSAVKLQSQLSQQLFQTSDIDQVYKASLHNLAEKQYDSLEHVLQLIAQISELNLVYLMRKADAGIQSQSSSQDAKDNSASTITPSPAQQKPESPVEQYLRRAQKFIAENNVAEARAELQEALKLEPNNSHCHSLMGMVYLRQNQATMAKVHFERALQLNPKDETALAGKRQLKPSEKSSGGGGVFGGLFGRKNK
jgi:curved DNA-binding protein CbpA